ncbi:lmbr1 domain-containing protein [Lasallia pustulata]|uniref:Lmbr1 domain-containing protein n=1 Tax=Lasallia pustulata TaxID=136370 RepID=A0A1W5CWE2_9LECA|nr:lmbr1 domain-containing protein [Lasallia pustulata]
MASGSSVGSEAFALLALLVISLLVLLLLRHFLPLRTTPAYLLTPVFLALALPASIVLLVPIDLASSSGTDDDASRGIWLPQKVVLVAWRVAYWLTFALTWVILPVLGEYTDSGFRTPKDRLLYSLRSNARYQLIVLGCGAVGLAYVFYENGFRTTSVKSLVMALAYFWGLSLAIYLMGHGLVAVPRGLFRNASASGRLRRIQAQAPKIHEKMTDAIAELDEIEAQVFELKKRKTGISRDHQEWIEDLAETSSLPESRATAPAVRVSGTTVPAVVTDRYLAELTRKLDRGRHKRVRFIDAWDRLTQEAADTQAILDAHASKRLDFGKASPHASPLERTPILTPYARYLLYAKAVPAVRVTFGGFFALASICIIWSELIKFAAPKLSIISYTVIHHRNDERGEIGFAGQVIASLWIFYMCAAALASFEDVKVWGNRALVRRNTFFESACWYAGQIAKLTVPLAYNFLTFLPLDIRSKTTFYQFLGRLIHLTSLGKGFEYFFPIFILVPVCATLFNLYGKVKNVFGFGILEDDAEDNPSGLGTGGWREGQVLIARELNGASGLALSSRRNQARSPLASGPSSPSTGNGGRRSQLPTMPNTASQAPTLAAEEDENLFQGFAHRVRNTFESVERPDWLAELGKRPRWMGGVGGSEEGRGRADSGRGLGRWFGRRPSDGRVRL